MITFDCGAPGNGLDFKRHIAEALSGTTEDPVSLLGGFAYVTSSGVRDLVTAVSTSTLWPTCTKRWLVGVHHGITEPTAINALATLPNSEVRLALCGQSLREAILGYKVFHAKVAAIVVDATVSMISAGSANLTGAAIGVSSRNYEAGLTFNDTTEAGVSTEFSWWWQDAWLSSVKATSQHIDRYIKARDQFLLRNPGIVLEAPTDSSARLATATTLWIEAGSMSGGSRNQVEFSADLAVFFGPVSPARRLLTVTNGVKTWSDRPLSPKRTSYEIDIWRLSLPTVEAGGYDYPGRIICFRREPGLRFGLEVADTESAEATSWREETHRFGTVARTGGSGGRAYGFR